ncbi:MAG: OB-fold domain-containing protein [Acidimicrobiales bacterium]
MSELIAQGGEIPIPIPSVLSEPYWDGCRRGVLRFQRCEACGSATHTPALLCAVCASRTLKWEDSSGRGEIYSWTRVWRPVTPAFVTPYVPVIVAVEEGWFILSSLIGCDHDAVTIGAEVSVVFHPVGGADDLWLPYFQLAPEQRSRT